MTECRRAARATTLAAAGCVIVAFARGTPVSATQASDDAPQLALAEQLATCAAYYFNASHARPMAEYETLYRAGERAVNRARRVTDAATAERLIGDASQRMHELTGGDWRRYEQITALHAEDCASLLGSGE